MKWMDFPLLENHRHHTIITLSHYHYRRYYIVTRYHSDVPCDSSNETTPRWKGIEPLIQWPSTQPYCTTIRADETMSPSAASSRTAASRLPARSQKGSSQPPRRSTKRQSRHTWTDEELNLLSHLRYLHRWGFKQIQKSYFPSLSRSALLGAYWRLSIEDRVRRASKVAAPITTPRNTTRDSRSAPNAQSTRPGLEQEPSYLHHPICPFSQAESSTETSILPSPSSATGDEPVA